MDASLCELILYACPTGDLEAQLNVYLAESQRRWGVNKAHQYSPHCSLTGFFHDQPQAIASYLHAIDSALLHTPPPANPIQITGMLFRDDWHGLTLESPWLMALTKAFAESASSTTRTDALRLKTWPHVSLAYGFEPSHGEGLKQLAVDCVNPGAAVVWNIRFYERSPANHWTCHGTWQLP